MFETRAALEAQWARQKARIEGADLGDAGRVYSEEDAQEYQHAKTRLDLGGYLRSRQIARFFFTRKFHLPDEDQSEALSPDLDYQDVKLKIVEQEGYDAHDFNLFDDRSSQLWRKPYVDGAVRELTAGDSRSQEQIRQAVEQMMIAARPGPFPPAAHKNQRARAGRTPPGQALLMEALLASAPVGIPQAVDARQVQCIVRRSLNQAHQS
jgi:hypothetical protein